MRIWTLVVLVCVTQLGCGAASVSVESAVSNLDPHHLYPMKPGAAWSYLIETDADTDSGTLAVFKVLSRHGQQVTVSSGAARTEYLLHPEGITRKTDGRWILRAPIAVGATWPSPLGSAKVVSIDERVQTPAQNFEHCVRVQEHDEEQNRHLNTVYCPGVGPVLIESNMQMSLSKTTPRVTARLLGYAL